MMACGMVVMLSAFVSAQYRVSSALFKPECCRTDPWSFTGQDTIRTDSANGVPLRPSKSPGTAVLLSAVLPGAGQVYTGHYWKVPVVLGLSGYFVYEVVKLNDSYTAARSKYAQSLANGENSGQGDPQLQYERDFYRDERDRFGFYFLLTYLLNIVDAYVDASLFDFDVGDNLGGGTSIQIRVPLR
jgi:hypothetical protein